MDKRERIEDLKDIIASMESGAHDSQIGSDNAGFPQRGGGQRLTALEETKQADAISDDALDASHCFTSAVSSLAASDQPASKIRLKLTRKGYPESIIENTVARLEELGYLDDLRYADAYIRSKLSQGKGLAGIKRDLVSSGIDSSQVQRLIDQHASDNSPEHIRAYQYLCAHPPRSKNLREGAYRKLISHGFSSDAAAHAARRWSCEQ